MKPLYALFFFICISLLVVPAKAQEVIVWNGSESNSWSVPGNWTPANVPDSPTEIARFQSGAPISVTLSTSPTLGGIEVANNTALTLKSDELANRTIMVNDNPGRDELVVAAGSSLVISGLNKENSDTELNLFLNNASATARINGVLEVASDDPSNASANGFLRVATGTFIIENGGELSYNRDAITLNFSATTTFGASSTLRIKGLRSNPVSVPYAGTVLTLGHLVVEAPDLRTNFCLVGPATTTINVLGNVEILRTGNNSSHYLTWNNSNTARAINVSGNTIIGNGTNNAFMSLKNITTVGNVTYTAGGDITVNAQGTFHQHTGTGIVVLGMEGGPATRTISGSGSINWSVSGATTSLVLANTTPAHTTIINRNVTVGSTTTINANATLAFATGTARTFRSSGNLSGAGTIDMSGGNQGHNLELLGAANAIGSFVAGRGTVQYEGNDQQVIGGISYFNLDIQGGNSNTKTSTPANSNVTILNRIQLQNGVFTTGTGLVLMANNSSVTRTERGSYTGSEFSVVNVGDRYSVLYNSTLTITRALTTGPEFASGSNIISGLTVAVGTGNYVTLNTAKTIRGTFTLTSGYLALSQNNLTIADGASFSGGSATSHIVTNGAGSLIKEGNANADFERTYPLGNGAVYTPLVIQTLNRTGTGWVSIRRTSHRHLTLRKQSALTRYFTLNSGGGLTVTNWRGNMTHGAGESVPGTNTVGYLADLTSINWIQNPNGATYSGSTITVPANTTQFNGAWTAGVNGATNAFDFSSFEVATTAGNWNDNATWQDGSVPAAGSNVIINANVTVNTAINMASLSVTTAGSITTSNHAITLSGDLLVEGTWTDNNAAGSINVTGDVAIAGPTTIGTQPLDITGNLYLNFDGFNYTGAITMRGADARIFGAGGATISQILAANGATVSVFTNAVGSGLTLSGFLGNVSGNTTGRFRMGANGIMTITSANPNSITSGGDASDLTNFDFSAAGSQVRYNRGGDQNVISTVYARLEIGGSGNKSLTNQPNAAETQVLENINLIGGQTLRSTATGADSLVLGSRTAVNTATITNGGTITLNNGKRTHFILRAGGNPLQGSGGYTFGHIWFRTTRVAPAAPANVSITVSYSQTGDAWHIHNNTITQGTGNTTTINGALAQSFNSQSTGAFIYGNLRIRTANTVYTLNAPITVTGTSSGNNANGSNAAFAVENTSGTRLALNGQTVTYSGSSGSTLVFGNNGLDASLAGSRIDINQAAGNTCEVYSSYASLPLVGFRVTRGNPNFITPTTLNGPVSFADVTTFTGLHTISHVPSPATQRNYEGTAQVNWEGNVVINTGARLNANQNIVFTGNTFTNNSNGVSGTAMDLGTGSFSMVRIGTGSGNIQTIVAAAGTGRLVCQDLIIDGQADRVLPAGEIQVIGSATFGPGVGPLVSTGTTGVVRIGSDLTANTAYLENNLMQVNTAGASAFTRYIFHGTGNVIRSTSDLPMNTQLGEVVINTIGSSSAVAPEGNFSIGQGLVHTSNNNFEPAVGTIIQTGLDGRTAVISGASTGQTIMPSWWVGRGGDAGISRITRTVTVRDSIVINQGTNSYLDFANARLNLSGVYRPVANPMFRANNIDVPGTAALHINGNATVTGLIRFETGFNAIDQLVYNKTGNSYTLGSSLILKGTSAKMAHFAAGLLINTLGNNLIIDAADVLVRHSGGATSVPVEYSTAAVADVEVLAGNNLASLNLPGAGTNSLRNLTINTGATVSLGGTPRNVRGNLNLNSGTLAVGNTTLTLGGNINNNGGNLSTTGASNLVLNGTATQQFPENVFVAGTPTINNLTISNTSAGGVVLTNQGMNVAGNITFTAGAGSLHTPLDETKPIILTNNGSVTGEAAGRYVVGALVSSRVATAVPNLSMGVGVSIQGVDAATAAVLNSVGGSFTVTRLAGRSGHVSNGNPGFATNQSIQRIWKFSPVGQLPKNVTINLSWVSNDDNACGAACDVKRVIAFRRASSSDMWTRIRPAGTSSPYGNADLGNGLRAFTSITNSFTDYTVGYFDAPLPVTWLGVQAQVVEKEATTAQVNVSWKTASELNNAYFIVERSIDQQHYVSLGRVEGAGTKLSISSYNLVDATAPLGTVYYRIRQVDLDGKTEVSPYAVIKTNGSTQRQLNIWPNPSALGQAPALNVLAEEVLNLQVMDAQGKLVTTYTGMLQDGQLPAAVLPSIPGVYYLNVVGAEATSRVKWVVR